MHIFQKISGKVLQGNQLGRTIGFPTANISGDFSFLDNATYQINIFFGGEIFSGIGAYLPEKKQFEAHIFDFDKNIYDEHIEVFILKKIRDNKKFFNFDELKKQIFQDKQYAIKNPVIGITFGTFDYVHPGHRFYLENAKKYCNFLVTIVATDKNVLKIKKHLPERNIFQRIEDVKNLEVADEIISGEEENNLFWVEKYDPDFVYLGYDQKGFFQKLQEFLSQSEEKITVLRGEPFQEKKYKSSLLK